MLLPWWDGSAWVADTRELPEVVDSLRADGAAVGFRSPNVLGFGYSIDRWAYGGPYPRRTLTGRVVRWARVRLQSDGYFGVRVTWRDGSWINTSERTTDRRTAESRAMAATR